MTIKDIENDARLLVLDTYEDAYRFAPKEIYDALRKAIVNTRKVRPESCYIKGLYTDFSYPDEVITTDAANITVSMEDQWREALVYYVVYQLYMKDDPDTQNLNLSKEYLSRYQTTVMT